MNPIKKGYIVLFVSIIALQTYAQDSIYSIAYTMLQPESTFEDRDTANYFYIDSSQTNNIWQIGIPSKTIFNNAYSAPFALITDSLNVYSSNNNSSFEFVVKTDDLTYISFWHSFNTDTLIDGGIVEILIDGSSNWTNIIDAPQFILSNFYTNSDTIISNSNKPGFSGNSSGWIQSTIQGYALDFVRFRFTFTSDSTDTSKEGWIIDNFDFNCLGTSIKEQKANSFLKIFPNPTPNFISIGSNTNLDIQLINIKDIYGRIVLTTAKNYFDISHLNSGYYFAEIIIENEKHIKSIQKQ